jgi:hypothetical protein
VEKIIREIQAKRNFIESLTVYNNSNTCQTFVCKIEPTTSTDKASCLTKFKLYKIIILYFSI